MAPGAGRERETAPSAGGAPSRALARGVLRLAGWRIEGVAPPVPKLVLVGAPHTTNLDFALAKLTAAALGVRLCWVGKASLFRGPFGWIGRRLGGIAVDRGTSAGFVAAMVEEFRRRDRFYLALMPAGTRSAPDSWRSGFYYIARDARVPLYPVAFDWEHRTMRLGPLLHPRAEESFEDALPQIRSHFAGVRGRRDAA
jgi:1-acyl-sn-glycerol-3-phosphate acyltransferase